jgi:DtxR family Mn-dependent transcriptional regulator
VTSANTALLSDLLADVIGLDWSLVHEEACRWEHVMSEQVERKLIAMLGQAHRVALRKPHPGYGETLAVPLPRSFSPGVIRVTDFAATRTSVLESSAPTR